VREVVESPVLSPVLRYVARPRAERRPRRIALVEDLEDLERVPEMAIVLLTRATSAQVASYRFDVALRRARARSVAAIVLSAPDAERLTASAQAVAAQSGIVILSAPAEVDLAELALLLGRELAADADVALRRAHAAVLAVAAHPADGGTGSLIDCVGGALGMPLTMQHTEPANGRHLAVVVDGRVEGWLAAPARNGALGMGVDIALHATAAGIGAAFTRARNVDAAPDRALEGAITDLLSATPPDCASLLRHARRLGLHVDGWHLAVRLEADDTAADRAPGALEVSRDPARHGYALLRQARAVGGEWHIGRAGAATVLLRVFEQDPGPAATAGIAEMMGATLAGLRDQQPSVRLRCGIGGAHEGAAGLLASADEARAAFAHARSAAADDLVVVFNGAGLRGTLVEWYASRAAREAAGTVLAPLVDLGGARAERLIQTLRVYLDQRGSLTKTADALHLHRNAVAYRVNQIFDLLDVDQEDPDDLLLLQLACRARELD
jgi:sugar diacid utilization regulator